MNITVLLFGIWSAFLAAFGFAMTRHELTAPVPAKRADGSTLSPRSINWIAAIGLIGAVTICCLD